MVMGIVKGSGDGDGSEDGNGDRGGDNDSNDDDDSFGGTVEVAVMVVIDRVIAATIVLVARRDNPLFLLGYIS